MDVITACGAHLAGLSAITALVSTRIHTPVLPAKCTYPAIQLQLISDVEGSHLRGPDGLFKDRIQLDSWATTRDGAVVLGRLCRQRLNGFAGVWLGTGSPVPEMRVQLIRYDVGAAQYIEEINHGLSRHVAEYEITFTDSEEELLIAS